MLRACIRAAVADVPHGMTLDRSTGRTRRGSTRHARSAARTRGRGRVVRPTRPSSGVRPGVNHRGSQQQSSLLPPRPGSASPLPQQRTRAARGCSTPCDNQHPGRPAASIDAPTRSIEIQAASEWTCIDRLGPRSKLPPNHCMLSAAWNHHLIITHHYPQHSPTPTLVYTGTRARRPSPWRAAKTAPSTGTRCVSAA